MSEYQFSANLGFLWRELSLPDAIRAAACHGFAAVECHWPYDEDKGGVRDALFETGLPLLSINTRCGSGASALGYAALPDFRSEARNAIDEAMDWASRFNVPCVHVMAGMAAGSQARNALIENLLYACDRANSFGKTVLIEPLNPNDAPGYFYSKTAEALDIIEAVASPDLKLMFDCYHVGRVENQEAEAIAKRLHELLPFVGHIQFAAVPDRGPPDHGSVDFPTLFKAIIAMGWNKPLGAEYRVTGATENTLGWMDL